MSDTMQAVVNHGPNTGDRLTVGQGYSQCGGRPDDSGKHLPCGAG